MKEINDEDFDDTLLAIDEFHHTSADANSNLGDCGAKGDEQLNGSYRGHDGQLFPWRRHPCIEGGG